ncbi:MAG: hypothetical protein K2W85_15995, partial [Phycisphaerales bacterium]|nr:hypothetical protein [Phycisphaerales bacterium]
MIQLLEKSDRRPVAELFEMAGSGTVTDFPRNRGDPSFSRKLNRQVAPNAVNYEARLDARKALAARICERVA